MDTTTRSGLEANHLLLLHRPNTLRFVRRNARCKFGGESDAAGPMSPIGGGGDDGAARFSTYNTVSGWVTTV